MPIGVIVGVLTRPWVVAGMGSTAAYLLYKKTRDQRDRIKEAKVEVIEMQRTIDRLRAELGRERSLRIEDHQGPQY